MAGHNHGNTPAAWTAVVIIFAGFGVGGAYTVLAEPIGVLAGAVIVALGGGVGLVMRGMGLGRQPAASAQGTHAGAEAGQALGETVPGQGKAEQAAVGG